MHCHDMRLELRWLIFYLFRGVGLTTITSSVTPITGSGLDQPGYVPLRIIRRPSSEDMQFSLEE